MWNVTQNKSAFRDVRNYLWDYKSIYFEFVSICKVNADETFATMWLHCFYEWIKTSAIGQVSALLPTNLIILGNYCDYWVLL